MNAAIYARVSTAQQAEHGYSLETQIDACKQKALSLGATSIKEYIDDGYSGAYMERPALDNLRDALSANLHDIVVIYDTDRLARDMMVQLLITEEIEKHASLVFVNSEYNKSPESQLFYQIKGSFAEYERVKIQDRMNRGRRGKLKQGKPIRDSKILGYDFIDGQYVINQQEANIVRHIFEAYLNTTGGLIKVSKKLFADGILSVSGTRMSISSLGAILHRQNYTGHYFAYTTYRKKTGSNTTKVIHRDSTEWIPMKCPQIIPQELFDAVQNKLGRNRKNRTREGKYPALFQGLLYCGICGHKMYKIVYSNKAYYLCRTQKESLTPCTNRMCNVEILDAIIWEKIMDICRSDYTIRKYVAKSVPKNDNTSIQEKLDKINQTRKNIMTLYTKSLISIEECTEQLETLKKKERTLSEKLSPTPKEKVIDYTAVVKAIKNAMTYEDKRSIVTNFISKVTVIRKGNKRQHGYSLDLKIEF